MLVCYSQRLQYYDAKKMAKLLKKRKINGKPISKGGKSFAEWSKKGRLIERFKPQAKPFYVKNTESLENGEKYFDILNNHKTSNQNETVIERLGVILKNGNYRKAQPKLEKLNLSTNKRNYNVLKPDEQSSTIMTIADDYIHYNSPRSLTVREMARLQSFDDSFVFQGKRSREIKPKETLHIGMDFNITNMSAVIHVTESR